MAQAQHRRRNRMTERKWTPGPWVVCEYCEASDEVVVVANGAEYITSIDVDGQSNSDTGVMDQIYANAHLIAAAPDLYEACEEFVRKCDIGQARSTNSYNQMKSALAKAR